MACFNESYCMYVKCREEVGEGNDSDNGSCQVRLRSSEGLEGVSEKDYGMYVHQCSVWSSGRNTFIVRCLLNDHSSNPACLYFTLIFNYSMYKL